MKLKIALVVSSLILFAVGLIIATSREKAHPHYKLSEFLQEKKDTARIPQKTYITLYGKVKEGSIRKKGAEAEFVLKENNFELPVYFTGKNLLPDTFQDGSDAAVSGYYHSDQGIFVAHNVLAKCASKYEAAYKTP